MYKYSAVSRLSCTTHPCAGVFKPLDECDKIMYDPARSASLHAVPRVSPSDAPGLSAPLRARSERGPWGVTRVLNNLPRGSAPRRPAEAGQLLPAPASAPRRAVGDGAPRLLPSSVKGPGSATGQPESAAFLGAAHSGRGGASVDCPACGWGLRSGGP